MLSLKRGHCVKGPLQFWKWCAVILYVTRYELHFFYRFWYNFFQVVGQGLSSNAIFAPIVTATCRAGMMTVKVETLDNFLGVVQSRDYRKPECSGYGENSRITYLRVNMLADDSDPEYCGVFINEVRQNANEFSASF